MAVSKILMRFLFCIFYIFCKKKNLCTKDMPHKQAFSHSLGTIIWHICQRGGGITWLVRQSSAEFELFQLFPQFFTF